MLIQGTNTPVVIEFDEDTADMIDISVALVCDSVVKKRWAKDEITLEGKFAYCPLEQEGTMDLPVGFANLEVKWTNREGEVNFSDVVVVKIEKRADHTILLEA